MKKYFFSFGLLVSILIGTSTTLLGQDDGFHSNPPKVWEGEVIMKAPENALRAVEEFINTDPRVISLHLKYTGYTVNFSAAYVANYYGYITPKSLFGVICAANYGYGMWYIVEVTSAGEVLGVDYGGVFDPDKNNMP